jgi:SAM-dependent methyltransferase
MSASAQPGTTTAPGLHEYLLRQVLPRYFRAGERAIDLGAGSGALALRLRDAGWNVLSADVNQEAHQAGVPFVQVDFNQQDFASTLDPGSFGLVTSVEVIEHVESPIGFLRNIRRLLKPGGVAVLTTPNVDSTPARVKFLLRGTIRMMDAQSEKTHITPIFWDLFTRQYLPRAELQLLEHRLYPDRGYQMTRPGLAGPVRFLSLCLRGDCLQGDNHIIILGANQAGKEGGLVADSHSTASGKT